MKKSKRMKIRRRAASKLNSAFAFVALSKSGQDANGRGNGIRGPKPIAGTFGAASEGRQIEITDEIRERYEIGRAPGKQI